MSNKAQVVPSFDNAIIKTGYGKFHFMVFLLVGCAYSLVAMETLVVAFVIPAARCDFNMSSKDAGLMTALPQIGTVIGAFTWGILGDLYGRKWILVMTILCSGLTSLLSSMSQYFSLFMFFRIANSLGLAGILSVCLPYLAEFQPESMKEKVVSWMEFWWSVGMTISPCLAWLIIPLNLRFESTYFNFSSWNLYVMANASLMMTLGFVAIFFPESPKYYEDIGEHEKALDVLRYVFRINTGKNESLYTVDSIEEKSISVIGGYHSPNRPKRTFQTIFFDMKKQTRLLSRKPYFVNICLVCAISFIATGVYYVFMLWFPELFSRFQNFEMKYPGESTSVCDVSSTYLEENECTDEVDSRVFRNTIIIGLSCIPTSLWLSMCINRLGCKFFLVFCMMVSGASCLAMFYVTTSFQNLILSCIFEAFASLSVMSLFCCLVDLFPSSICAMANGLCISFGKLGALGANLFFGYLIDYNCAVPTFFFAAIMIVSGFIALALPLKGRTTTENAA